MGNNGEHDDGLVDFGSPSAEAKEETGETKTQTDENMEQATKDEAEKEEPETPATNPDYLMVTGATTEATAETTTDVSQSIIA